MKTFLAKLTLALAFVAVPCFPVRALQSSTRERSISEVVKASDAAVVLIETADSSGRPLSQGSGFIISSDGVIVTNHHVVDGASSVSVTLNNGASFSAQGTVHVSEDADFALLKVPGKDLPFIKLAESNSVTRGERVIAVGSPLGLQNSVSDGIVSGLRTLNGTPYIQTSAPVSHGDSGGPLLNSNGAAIGVLTFRLKGEENLNFALSVDVLKPYAASRTLAPFQSVSSNNAQTSAPTTAEPAEQGPAGASGGRPSTESFPAAGAYVHASCHGSQQVNVYSAPSGNQVISGIPCGARVTVLRHNVGPKLLTEVQLEAGRIGYVYPIFLDYPTPSLSESTKAPQSHSDARPQYPQILEQVPGSELSKLEKRIRAVIVPSGDADHAPTRAEDT